MSSLKKGSSKKLTNLFLKNAEIREKDYKISAENGLYVLVTKAGSKLWRMKYRLHGKEYLLSLGKYPEVSIADARMENLKAKKLLAEGIDPRAVMKSDSKKEGLTFKCVAERWYEGRTQLAVKKWSDSTAEKVRIYLEKDIYPAFGSRLISEITRPEIIRLNEEIEKRGAFDIAKKVRQWLTAIFSLAYDNCDIPNNPALNLKPGLRAHGVRRKHYPFVGFVEIPDLLRAVDNADSNLLYKLAIKLLMLTATRPSELRLSKWEEFNLPAATWIIPKERMKMRREHVVPLPEQALSILSQIREITGHQDFVFVGRSGTKPFSENTVNLLLKKVGYAGRQTGHGFRHLLSTELNGRGYNRDWIEAQIAHEDEDETRRTYNHAQYIEERRVMMQEWADAIDELVVEASKHADKLR